MISGSLGLMTALFFIAPPACVPNGFDQYNSQMMMLPYGFPPYMCSPEDVISPTGLNEEESEQNRTSVESHEVTLNGFSIVETGLPPP